MTPFTSGGLNVALFVMLFASGKERESVSGSGWPTCQASRAPTGSGKSIVSLPSTNDSTSTRLPFWTVKARPESEQSRWAASAGPRGRARS